MPNLGHKLVLAISFVPYLCLALYDGWLHEKARSVPIAEQATHALLVISLAAFASGVFLDLRRLVLPALAVLIVATLADELGFHGSLPSHERRIHFAAYACLGLFAAVAFAIRSIE
jgi:hypothetical protein